MVSNDFRPAFFTVDDRGAVLVATVTEPCLRDEDNIEQFGVELNQAIEHYGVVWFVLDLSLVTLISSSAIGKLIGLHRGLHRQNGRLALCGISGTVQKVLQTAKLIEYFNVSATASDAVDALVIAMRDNEPPTMGEAS